MDQTELLLIVAVLVIVAAAFLLLWRRRDRSAAPPATGEGHGVGDSAAAAVQDVAGQFLGVDAHPDLPRALGPADDLTRLKGLGPKAAAMLNTLGITRFDQLAQFGDAEIAAVDAQMGPFKGRITRDQWVEQARYLAAGDTAGFEQRFGKLGG